MAREFFTGGIMPSASLLHHFQDDLTVIDEWHLAGTHYARTAEAWYERLMARRTDVERIFAAAYGAEAARRFQRWRLRRGGCVRGFHAIALLRQLRTEGMCQEELGDLLLPGLEFGLN